MEKVLSVEDAIRIAQRAKDPHVLLNLYEKYKTEPKVVMAIVDNPNCPAEIRSDYLKFVLDKLLPLYSRILKDRIPDWDTILNAMEKCIQAWNPSRAVAPIPKVEEDERLLRLFNAIMSKDYKQIILYGPPGTSKTYYARGLALAIAEGKEENVEFVQFHSSYSYEDFIEALMPEINDKTGSIEFKPKDKLFKEFCKRASRHPDQKFVLIIDEINRADLSKVFGEIFSALEYRQEPVRLLYSNELFVIPQNVYIIGTMNTIDKSVVDLDIALIRRFKFFKIEPDVNILKKILTKNNVPPDYIEKIARTFVEIQRYFPLGHAYFKDISGQEENSIKQSLIELWNYQLAFLLEQYFGELEKEKYEKIKEIYSSSLEIPIEELK